MEKIIAFNVRARNSGPSNDRVMRVLSLVLVILVVLRDSHCDERCFCEVIDNFRQIYIHVVRNAASTIALIR